MLRDPAWTHFASYVLASGIGMLLASGIGMLLVFLRGCLLARTGLAARAMDGIAAASRGGRLDGVYVGVRFPGMADSVMPRIEARR